MHAVADALDGCMDLAKTFGNRFIIFCNILIAGNICDNPDFFHHRARSNNSNYYQFYTTPENTSTENTEEVF